MTAVLVYRSGFALLYALLVGNYAAWAMNAADERAVVAAVAAGAVALIVTGLAL